MKTEKDTAKLLEILGNSRSDDLRGATDEVSSDGLQEVGGPYSYITNSKPLDGEFVVQWRLNEKPFFVDTFPDREAAHAMGERLVKEFNTAHLAGAQAERERFEKLAAEPAPSLPPQWADHDFERYGDPWDGWQVTDAFRFGWKSALESAANPDNQGATA